MGTATLPGCEPKAQRDGNDLTAGERGRLVASCEGQCRKLARDLAGHFGRRHEAEDVEQDARLACVEAAAKWDPAGGVKFVSYATAYIRQSLTRSLVLHAQAVGGKDARTLDSWDGVPDARTEDARLIPSGRRRGPTEAQRAMLGPLPEPDRTLVRLVRFDGFTVEQAADQCGVSVKDAKLFIRNAAAALAAAIDRADAADGRHGGGLFAAAVDAAGDPVSCQPRE